MSVEISSQFFLLQRAAAGSPATKVFSLRPQMAGRTGRNTQLNTTENINEIFFRNDDNGYLVAGKKMFKTNDAGATWCEIVIFRVSEFRGGTPEFLSIRFADKRRGFVVGSILNKNDDVIDSLVMRTEDGGETWSRVLVPSKFELFHLDFNGSSNGWIVGDRGTIMATTDGGMSWVKQTSGTERALYNVDFRDKDEGYAVGGKGTILRTENGGRSWMRVPTQFTDTFMRVDFADDKNGWIVGHKGTILRSSNKGVSWIKQDGGTSKNLYGLYMTKKYGWAVGEDGQMVEYVR